MHIIEAENLTKIYKQRQRQPGIVSAIKTLFKEDVFLKTAIHDISFSIEEGEVVGLLGPNGAGKTTVLKILAGILYPTSGYIEVAGYTPCLREDSFKKSISLIVGQKNQMMWDLPAMDTLLWLKEIYDIPTETFKVTLNKLTEIFQAETLLNLQVRRMSLGQRMKMELIASMLHMPKVVFLDEPTIGLDIVSQNSFREFIKEYNRQTGATIILTSHNLMDIETLCQKVILINQGTIMRDKTLSELCAMYDYKIITVNGFVGSISNIEIPLYLEILSKEENTLILRTDKEHCKQSIKHIWSNFTFADLNISDIPISEIIENEFSIKE